jgi:hypothetical protein
MLVKNLFLRNGKQRRRNSMDSNISIIENPMLSQALGSLQNLNKTELELIRTCINGMLNDKEDK